MREREKKTVLYASVIRQHTAKKFPVDSKKKMFEMKRDEKK